MTRVRTPPLRRHRVLAPLLTVWALVAAGCGGDGDGAAPLGAPQDEVGDSAPTEPAGSTDGETAMDSDLPTEADADEEGTDSAAADGETVTIGGLVALSGTFATVGEDILQGFELYVEQQDGLLGGRPVEVIREDEEDPDVAVRKAQKLIQVDEVDAVFGIVSSAAGVAVRDVFDRNEVPVVITNSNVTSLSCEASSDYVYRTSYTFHQAGFISGRWFAENVGTEGVFIIAPDYVGGQDMLAAFKLGFADGGGSPEGIVGEAYPPFQSTDDYQPYISEIQNSGAQYVWAFFGGGEAVSFVNQYEAFGLKATTPLYGWAALADDGILESLGPAGVGVTTMAQYSADLENPVNDEFRAAYQEAFGEEPTYFAESSYVAAQMLDQAIGRIDGEVTPQALAEQLEDTETFAAPRGEFQLNPETNNPVVALFARTVEETEDGTSNVVVGDAGTIEDACPAS